MDHNIFATLDLLDETQLGLAQFLDPNATPLNFEQPPDKFENYWITDDILYPDDLPTWWGGQRAGNLEISLPGDQPREPYSSSDFMTFDQFDNDFLATANMDVSTSTAPELGLWSTTSEQGATLSTASFSDPLPSDNMQQTISPPDQSAVQSRTTVCSDINWICNYCSRSFTKKYLRTKHEQVHTRPITCPLAPIYQHRIAMKRDMRRHIDVHHAGDNNTNPSVSSPNFTCAASGCRFEKMGFKRKDHLTRHVKKVHTRLIP